MAQHRRTFAPWFFIALVLSNHGIAMAARINHHDSVEEVVARNLATGPHEDALRNSHENYQHMSCDELAGEMGTAMGEAVHHLTPGREQAAEVQNTALLTIRISAIADVADRKLCLPEVFSSPEGLDQSQCEAFIAAATSEDAQDRFQRALSRMSAVQSDLLDLHGEVLNRHVLLPNDIEDPANCPSPCTSCTREHNSWSQDSEDFHFKCIMPAGSARPTGEGFTCEEPTPRRSNRNEMKAWCEVHHWQAAAAQTLDISAKAACGARSILAPLQHGGDMSEMAVSACEKEMTGEALTQDEVTELRRLDSEIDQVVSPGNLAAFSLYLIIGLMDTIAELRLRSRAPSSLVEAEQQQRPGQAPIAYTQGSWRCRRSLLSLANGLFGAMIEIVIGIAYLAIMGTLGLLAAMSVFGADTVVATLAPYAGLSAVTMGEVLQDTAAAASDRIAQFLLNRQIVADTLINAGEAGAAASGGAGGNAVAIAAQDSLSDTVGEAGAALAETVETLGGFGDQIMQYWPAVAGGLTILSVGFGIWGLARLWHSFDNPHDCSSGYVHVGGVAVCHPALKYGEAHHADCPGPQPNRTEHPELPRNDLAFVCSRSNGGITTFISGTCQPDRL
jgi:hypothetical protein